MNIKKEKSECCGVPAAISISTKHGRRKQCSRCGKPFVQRKCKCVKENGKVLMVCAEHRKEEKPKFCQTCHADLPPNHFLRK